MESKNNISREHDESPLALAAAAMPLGLAVFRVDAESSGGRLIEANRAFCEIIGRELSEIVGAEFDQLFPDAGEWEADVAGMIRNAAGGGKGGAAEVYLGPPVRKWVSARVFPARPGEAAALFEDVTAGSRAKQALMRQRSHVTF